MFQPSCKDCHVLIMFFFAQGGLDFFHVFGYVGVIAAGTGLSKLVYRDMAYVFLGCDSEEPFLVGRIFWRERLLCNPEEFCQSLFKRMHSSLLGSA